MIVRLLLLLILCGGLACAVPGTITGGPRDETPPQLIPESSTPGQRTNFRPTVLEFTFDEWIQLEDVQKQVLVSPPLAGRPDISIRKKTVRFEFPEGEQLRDSATYTINFGEAVQDLNEGNPAELRYVFSTGAFIDSLSISARVIDALDGKPVENALVLLYDNTADSVVYTERPFYFGRTDKEGNTRIDNLKAGIFKIVALEDANADYRYAPTRGERFAYLDTLIRTDDPARPNYEFRLFTRDPDFALTEVIQERYGLTKLVFNRPPDSTRIDWEDFGQYVRPVREGDTIRVWYDAPDRTEPWQLYVPIDSADTDSIRVRKYDRAKFLETAVFTDIGSRNSVRQNPDRRFRLPLNQPLRTIDTALIEVYTDTLRIRRYQPPVVIDSADVTRLIFRQPWQPGLRYEFQLLPGALTSIYGQTNTDTIRRTLDVLTRDRFGTLNLTINRLDSTQVYLLEILNPKKRVIERFRLVGQSEFKRVFTMLEKGKYSLRIIEDRNRNGRLDSGDYDLQQQPERLFERDLEAIREDWEVEAVVPVEFGKVD